MALCSFNFLLLFWPAPPRLFRCRFAGSDGIRRSCSGFLKTGDEGQLIAYRACQFFHLLAIGRAGSGLSGLSLRLFLFLALLHAFQANGPFLLVFQRSFYLSLAEPVGRQTLFTALEALKVAGAAPPVRGYIYVRGHGSPRRLSGTSRCVRRLSTDLARQHHQPTTPLMIGIFATTTYNIRNGHEEGKKEDDKSIIIKIIKKYKKTKENGQ